MSNEDQTWRDLATYNAEKRRGIVHTPEWVKRMARQQKVYDEVVRGYVRLPEGE